MTIAAATTDAEGNRYWRFDGMLHREDGPAAELNNGARLYYYRNVLHRANGPAIIWPNGHEEWWLHGKRHSSYQDMIEYKQLALLEVQRP